MNTPGGADLSGRVAHLHAAYRSAFAADFDLQTFERDDFYAFQVLEKAIREGAPELKNAAQEMEVLRLAAIDGGSTIELKAPPEPYTAPANPPAAAARPARAKRSEPERREQVVKGSGHVRLANREIVLLSQMRVQYRKTFGMFFDTVSFTGNDLYARAVLSLCLGSGNWTLAAMARQFQNDDGTPRFHRRLGAADVELAVS